METSIIFDQFDAELSKINITAANQNIQNDIVKSLITIHTHQNEKVKYSWEFKEGFSDANEYVFDKKNRTIPIGLIPTTVKKLKEKYPNIKIGVSDKIRNIFTPPRTVTYEEIKSYIESLKIVNYKTKKPIIPFDHQIRICDRIINGRRISVMACTSAGKSLSIMAIARYLIDVEKKKNVLIITPSSGLVVQLFNDFSEDYGWKEAKDNCTLVYGQSKDKLTQKQKNHLSALNLGEEVMYKKITISTWQSLQNKLPEECDSCKKIRMKKNKPIDCPECNNIKRRSESFFSIFDAVLVDEAHSTRGIVLRDVLSKCVNAIGFRSGMSGTLPDDGIDASWIEGALGRKEVVVKLHQLIELGILPPLKINIIKVPYPQTIRRFVCRQNYDNEYYLVTNNGSRKRVVELLIDSKKVSLENNTLILFKNLDTLENMHQYLKEKYPEFKYHIINGKVTTSDREEIRNNLSKSTGNIILATYGTMKQGVNIPLLHNLIFAEFSKSMYSIVQSIGRVARFHPLKDLSNVFDICDDCSYFTQPKYGNYPTLVLNYSMKHQNVRIEFYKNEKLPITEYSLEGIYEATINPEDLEKRKEKASTKVSSKSKKVKDLDIEPQFGD